MKAWPVRRREQPGRLRQPLPLASGRPPGLLASWPRARAPSGGEPLLIQAIGPGLRWAAALCTQAGRIKAFESETMPTMRLE